MKQSLGLYAGSFNPFHLGHWDVVKQASQVFDRMLVAKGNNPEKQKNELYPLPEQFLINNSVYFSTFDGLLVEFIHQLEREFNVTVVRGLRSGADLDYEQNFAAFLRGMYPQVKIVAFYCDPKLRHISSSSLRAIRQFSEDEYRKYVISN